MRENNLRFRRDLPVSLLLAIYFLSNYEKLLDIVLSVNYLYTYLIERINYRITEHRLPPASNKS